MDTLLMNSENCKNSKPHVLILNLTDKADFQRGEKSVPLSNLSMGKHKTLMQQQ